MSRSGIGQNPRQLAFDWEASGEAVSSSSQGSCRSSSSSETGALAQNLMEAVVAADNMRQALKRVRSNKGSPGIDAMTVASLPDYLRKEWPRLRKELLEGTYQPQPVKRVEIPKSGGGMRLLGIPTVVDRLIQQAILQVLDPLYDPGFSSHSYGFRKGRSAHQALLSAREFVASGKDWVVDIDLEKFFDRVNHDLLLGRLCKRIGDKRLLRLIRRYLCAGVLLNGVVMDRHEGTPQGGPLSPLLANILLADLDVELERRGHSFCRYADDCNIYVSSERAGQRVMASVSRYLEGHLLLRVNRDKSAVARPSCRKFLGYRIVEQRERTRLGIAPASLQRAKQRLRVLTQRRRGVSLSQVLGELRSFTDGWVSYFRLVPTPSAFGELDSWLRRRLRCFLWKQWKTARHRSGELVKAGLVRHLAFGVAYKGGGPWRCAKSFALHLGLPNRLLFQRGFHSLTERYLLLGSL